MRMLGLHSEWAVFRDMWRDLNACVSQIIHCMVKPHSSVLMTDVHMQLYPTV